MKIASQYIIPATLAVMLGLCGSLMAGGTATAPASAPTGKGGAQIWAENCQRCHNFRSPSSYSPAQWDVAMLHMRVRANLTPEQATKVLAFLKSGS
jgi:cytochrome c5